MSRAYYVSAAALSTALVAVLTLAVQVYIPETRGYFNFGELGVYAVALLFGSRIGAVAGGVGSALADLLTGYSYYAPGTLAIKGLEGFVVGYLYERLSESSRWRSALVCAIPVVVFALLSYVGYVYYSGGQEWTLGMALTATLTAPRIAWILLALGLASLFVYLSAKRPAYAAMVLASALGGCEMVLGYFLYEYLALGFGSAALVEVPFNVGQVLVGIAGSAPLVAALERVLGRARTRL